MLDDSRSSEASPHNPEVTPQRLKEIAGVFLKIGTTAYGGPAIMGVMQAEVQEKRQWISKERFVEGLALVNTLPGPGVIQLGIFLGHVRGGWRGGVIAGLCFMLPAFFIMLALTTAYAAFGATPLLKGALYGLGPVVIAVFSVAAYRLGRAVVTTRLQLLIALVAAVAAALNVGIVTVLGVAVAIGILLFRSRRLGAGILVAAACLIALSHYASLSSSWWMPSAHNSPMTTQAESLFDIGSFFFVVGAFSFGGGLSMIAFIQEQVVQNYHWLTQQEFIDGLALGQFTPGPILMVAAYVGYKLAGIAGATVAAIAIFLPSFILMLTILPIFERARQLMWTKAAMKGVGPAVIGVLTVSLLQMAPHALPDPFAIAILIGTVIALLAWRLSAIKLVIVGALLGVLRGRLALIAVFGPLL